MLISVIIQTFNLKEYLSEAIRSVREQSYKEWELIVVDDGSTDGTSADISWNGILYLRTDHSGYPGRVRNIGARAARGNVNSRESRLSLLVATCTRCGAVQ